MSGKGITYVNLHLTPEEVAPLEQLCERLTKLRGGRKVARTSAIREAVRHMNRNLSDIHAGHV